MDCTSALLKTHLTKIHLKNTKCIYFKLNWLVALATASDLSRCSYCEQWLGGT